jgi:hypothetical protein
MRMKIILSALIFLCISCCIHKKQKYKDATFLRIKIPAGQIQPIKMSEIISEFKAIKLEFTDQSMIGDIRKIVIHDNRIYVLDTFGAKSVMVFGMDGKFIHRIGTNGKGPGQYLLPKDFVIDDKNEIEIIDNQRINIYSLKGEFNRNHKISFGSENFMNISTIKKHIKEFISTGNALQTI